MMSMPFVIKVLSLVKEFYVVKNLVLIMAKTKATSRYGLIQGSSNFCVFRSHFRKSISVRPHFEYPYVSDIETINFP